VEEGNERVDEGKGGFVIVCRKVVRFVIVCVNGMKKRNKKKKMVTLLSVVWSFGRFLFLARVGITDAV
jgi:hypothetical protein